MNPLHTDRLMLRRLEPQDAAAMEKLLEDKEIADTTLGIPYPYPPGAADSFIRLRQEAESRGEGYSFGIIHSTSGMFMGVIGLHPDQRHHRAELAYWLGKPFWGEGYCTEAAQRIVGYAFDDLKLHKVWAAAMTRNPASIKVMEKCGMRREGLFRQHIRKWDAYEDLSHYAILRSER